MNPEPKVQATRYEVSCLPIDHPERRRFRLFVEVMDRYGWTVHDGGTCLDFGGGWADGMSVYERDDEWISAHRFDLGTALNLAKTVAPTMSVNGRTVAEVLARSAKQNG
jgi:hypothetical protein